ncbi:MAG: hypothetical protein AAFO29_04410 [Actinomycetota bacterium]
MNDEELDAALSSANPQDERSLARLVPPGVGEAMIREITATDRASFWQRLVDPIGANRRSWGRGGFVGVVAVLALAILAVNLVPTGGGDELLDPAAEAQAEECRASGTTLGEARAAYAESCPQPRLDCDPIDGEWICSNLQIGDNSPRPRTTSTSSTMPPSSTTLPPSTSSSTTSPSTTSPPTTLVSDDACVGYGNNLEDAKATYARECDEPRVDCDPVGDKWMCSSEQIGDFNPNPTTTAPGPNTTVPGSTTTARPPTTVSQPNTAACVIIEAETLGLVGDWKRRTDAKASGGAYITWEGLSHERNNGSPDDVITTSITISQAGTYRFVWAMRQPSDVESDKANDSWVNFPNAARFGPTTGGSYGGPVKVFGNGKGSFAWAAKADQNHAKSDVAIEFSRPGTYTMEIAGRSHGHQIDKIVVYRDSVSRNDAINGRCGDSNPTPDPEPDPNPTGVLGRFDLDKDILLCNYDSKPDEDDLHAVAGLGTMLRDPRIAGINFHCTAGAYGRQGGTFLDEPALFDLAFGDNWASAHEDEDSAVTIAANEAIAALDAGGDVWVTEAGQSDVTALIVKRIKSQRPGVNTNQRIHVVQHSNWNENQTTPSDLTYVKNNTQYNKIADGNAANNGTPQLTTTSSQYWSEAKSDAQVGALWSEADAAARRGFAVDWNNDKIVKGGMDFSDTVEPMYVFGFEGRSGNVGGFFDEFL